MGSKNYCQAGFSSIAKVLTHIYTVDLMWLETLDGKTMKQSMELVQELESDVRSSEIDEIQHLFGATNL
ncbi:DinB family protein [Gracilibacillus dipsosauri]|uniref:DinB family protein n=1 Tax=Gracilibacillus dipsosauri TaxID=178340 RepID=UPI003D3591F6